MIRTRETDKTHPACPYCEFKLNALPDKPGICPQCKNKVYVHFKQRIIDRIILTKAEAQVIARFMKLCKERGLTENDYHKKFTELQNQTGQAPKPHDVLNALEQKPEDVFTEVMTTSIGDADESVFMDQAHVFSSDESLIAKIQDEVENDQSGFLSDDSLPGLGAGDSLFGIETAQQPEQKKKTDIKLFAEESLSILNELGFTLSDAKQHHDLLQKKFKRVPHTAEIIFSLFEASCRKPQELHSKASELYLRLARLFHSYGLRCFSIHRTWAKHRLLALRDQGYEKVELVVASGNPELIDEYDGITMSLEDALNKLPLPDRKLMIPIREDDTIGWSECDYLPIDEAIEFEDAGFDGFLGNLKSQDSGLLAFE